MNRSTFALLVALLIHFIFMLIFWILGTLTPLKEEKIEENKIRVSLKELPQVVQKPIIKKEETLSTKTPIKQTPIAPPMPKGSQLQEIAKKKNIQYEQKKEPTTPKLNPPKKEKPKQKSSPIKSIKEIKPEKFIPLEKKTSPEPVIKNEPQTTKDQNSMNWLYEDKSTQEKPEEEVKKIDRTSTGRDIKELYGATFGELSQAQQEYILDNQEIMRRITQQVLTNVAKVADLRGLNVNKINVIEFYLHPNGDMSDFKFLQKSGYFILDRITKETIEYAYSKYPRPKEKTLIRYNVFYNLMSY